MEKTLQSEHSLESVSTFNYIKYFPYQVSLAMLAIKSKLPIILELVGEVTLAIIIL